MAVDFNGAKLLLWAKNLGASFERTLTLGHQGFACSPRQFTNALRDFGLGGAEDQVMRCFERASMGPLYADALFRFLGAKEIVTVDYSDFEGATLLHDLNKPFPKLHLSRYSFVFDGGTLEHVFDFPSALRHCLELVEPGGYFLSIAPGHNMMGHGFYQMSPELFFQVLSDRNGFVLRKMVLYEAAKSDAAFYQVNDPAVTGQRTELNSDAPMFLAVLAQRTALKPILAEMPMQSDYVAGWKEYSATAADSTHLTNGLWRRIRSRVNLYWPFWLRRLKQNLIYSYQHGRPTLRNRRHFRKLSRREITGERSSS